MLRRLIIVTFGWLLCLYLPAAYAGGALFKIQDDAHRTLYLFGTIHVGADDFYPLPPHVQQALEQAPAVALEIDPGNAAAMQTALQQYGYYPPGHSLRTDMDAPLQQQVLAALAKYHINADAVAHMRPWMLAALLTVQEFDRQGFHAAQSVDGYLANFISQRHKPVIELEGATAQLALFGALSPQQQNQLLQDTIKELEDPDTAARVVELAQCWRNADLPCLQRLLDEMAEDHSFVGKFTQEVLLDQRNPILATRIAALLARQDGVFAAVGILHLVGANSVPALLRQQGFTVEQID